MWDNANDLELQQILFHNNAQLVSYRDNLLSRVNSKQRFLILNENLGQELDLGGLLSSYDGGVKVKVYYAADSSLQEFIKLAAENLKQPGNFVIVNYLRKEIGQEKGGYISPLAAYNEATDRFLTMDVYRYKYPPV